MNLPEPTAHAISDDGITPHRLWSYGDGALLDTEVKRLGGTTAKMALYSEAQVKELLDQADRDNADCLAIAYLHGYDQAKKRYEPVLKIALESLDHTCGGRCNAEYNPCHARLAADTIRKLLG